MVRVCQLANVDTSHVVVSPRFGTNSAKGIAGATLGRIRLRSCGYGCVRVGQYEMHSRVPRMSTLVVGKVAEILVAHRLHPGSSLRSGRFFGGKRDNAIFGIGALRSPIVGTT